MADSVSMDKANRILENLLWKKTVDMICSLENERIFCKHDVTHFLDVARIAYIENLEKNTGVSKELIYAAALLHDIGRYQQYQKGISHEKAGEELAGKILDDCGFSGEEKKEILMAIRSHRSKDAARQDNLPGLIYRADKRSRNCMLCIAASECKWSDEKKNKYVM